MTTLDLTGLGRRLEGWATSVVRFGLAVVLIWIGAMKFTETEAKAIQPLVENSPFMAWVYDLFSVPTFAFLLGIAEIMVGLFIAARPLFPRLSALGGALAATMFLGTLSFLFTTPGWEASLGGFPALSLVPGQFLIKDVVLLGVALWVTGEALVGVQKSPGRESPGVLRERRAS